MREVIIAGNWKMNTTVSEARTLVEAMKPGLEAIAGVEKVVCPPFVSLLAVRDVLAGSSIAVGAQNMYFEESGAYTGEVSPTMLTDLCSYVIVGHSERRHILGETDSLVSRKVKACVDAGLRPILCVGEQLDDREEGLAEVIVEQQVSLGVARLGSLETLVLAYEPVWAIGTSRAATQDDAQAMIAFIRALLAQDFGDDMAAKVPILYGGSVNADNVASFMQEADVDGALVGGASLGADSFVELTRNAAAAA